GVLAPPVIDTTRITVGRGATVSGSATAISGAMPILAEVRNTTSGASVSGIAVASDGSFSASIPASAGDAISLVATDVNGATSGVVRVGVVPFGSSASIVPITAAMANNDGNFRARHIAIEGTTLAAVNYPISGTDTNKLVIFNIASGTPVWTQTITVPQATRDVTVKNNVAYVAASGALYAYDLSVNPAARQSAGSDCGETYSVAVDGA